MRTIPFFKPTIGDEEIREVVSTLKGGWLTTGPKVRQFESGFSDYIGQSHAVALNSCTAALHLALEAIGLEAGECVVVPSMTFAATAEVVRYFGARPILVECRDSDLNLDVVDAEKRIKKAIQHGDVVKAIIPVHYAGQIGDVAGVKELAGRYNLKVIEDAAHCCPAHYRDEDDGEWLSVGNAADISCFSFYANKTITTGEGGMACTNNEEYAERIRLMSLHGISKDAWKRYFRDGNWYYEIVAPGYKYNMADIAASLGIHQLRSADTFRRRRVHLAEHYSDLLSDVEELRLPTEMPNRQHSWHLYVVRLNLEKSKVSRNEFISGLKEYGVSTSVHFTPLHMHPYYRETYGYQPLDLPRTAGIYEEIVTLPLYPAMELDDINYVCDGIKSILSAGKVDKTKVFEIYKG